MNFIRYQHLGIVRVGPQETLLQSLELLYQSPDAMLLSVPRAKVPTWFFPGSGKRFFHLLLSAISRFQLKMLNLFVKSFQSYDLILMSP